MCNGFFEIDEDEDDDGSFEMQCIVDGVRTLIGAQTLSGKIVTSEELAELANAVWNDFLKNYAGHSDRDFADPMGKAFGCSAMIATFSSTQRDLAAGTAVSNMKAIDYQLNEQ